MSEELKLAWEEILGCGAETSSAQPLKNEIQGFEQQSCIVVTPETRGDGDAATSRGDLCGFNVSRSSGCSTFLEVRP